MKQYIDDRCLSEMKTGEGGGKREARNRQLNPQHESSVALR
jgi:hypothetical protein